MWGSSSESYKFFYVNTQLRVGASDLQLNLIQTHAFMWNWFGGGSQSKAQTCWGETIEFPATYYFCFPTISNLLSASAETLNGQSAATHTRLEWPGQRHSSSVYKQQRQKQGVSKVWRHTCMTQRTERVKGKQQKRWETRSLFPRINTNGKRQSIPLMLHCDKVLRKFIWALQVDSF